MECPDCGTPVYCPSCLDATPISGVCTRITNPITGTMADLVPPIEIRNRDEFEAFTCWVNRHCLLVAAGGADPSVIDASAWRD